MSKGIAGLMARMNAAAKASRSATNKARASYGAPPLKNASKKKVSNIMKGIGGTKHGGFHTGPRRRKANGTFD